MKVKPSSSLLVLALFFAACSDKDETTTDSDASITVDSTQPGVDADNDGVTVEDGDCDDANADVFPGQLEECNGIDDNCNDLADEGFPDADGDAVADCQDSEDCDGADNDGDGGIDEGFADVDQDGVADCVDSEDCDGLDNDDDGLIDEGYDADGDGVTQCENDCDDGDASAYPGASEVADDGVDNDCDQMIDELPWVGGELVLNEVMNNPSRVTDPMGEWIEVYNSTDGIIYLDGLVLTSLADDGSTESHVIAPDSPLPVEPGAYAVLGSNSDYGTNGGVDVAYEYSGITLSNESDTLSIWADTVEVDSLEWDDGATMPDPDGGSISLDMLYRNSTDNDSYESWCGSVDAWGLRTDFGSPNGDNELCSHIDHDFDGYTREDGDCNDADPAIYPGAPETDPSVDNDCDGEIESMPVADADYDTSTSSLEHCSIIYLDGSASYDNEGASLSYAWELTSAPSGSAATTSDIVETTDQMPQFTPDVAGDYTFSLTVNDGGADSFPDYLTVTVVSATSDGAPTANAGTDQDYSDNGTCQAYSYGAYYECSACADKTFNLDGTGTTDAEDTYWLTASWAVETDYSSYASLDDSTSWEPIMSVSGITPDDYGDATLHEIDVTLTVTDCNGSTDDDTVTINFTCTGT